MVDFHRMTYISSTPPRQFPVILQEDEDGGYVASCPLFDGCFSQGNTEEEALTHITEAIQLCAEEALERGELSKEKLPRIGLRFVTIP